MGRMKGAHSSELRMAPKRICSKRRSSDVQIMTAGVPPSTTTATTAPSAGQVGRCLEQAIPLFQNDDFGDLLARLDEATIGAGKAAATAFAGTGCISSRTARRGRGGTRQSKRRQWVGLVQAPFRIQRTRLRNASTAKPATGAFVAI